MCVNTVLLRTKLHKAIIIVRVILVICVTITFGNIHLFTLRNF